MPPTDHPSADLERGALSFRDSLVMAISSVSPAYSVALSFVGLGAAVALQMPAAVLLGFLPNIGMAIAFYKMNRLDPDCGTAYTWVSRSLSPTLGFMCGWVLMLETVIAMAFATPLLGQITLELISKVGIQEVFGFSLNPAPLGAAAAVGIAWMCGLTWILVRGIRVAAHFQYALLMIECLVVGGFSIAGLVAGGGPPISLDWLNPFHISTFAGLASGMVVSVFLYAGWVTPIFLNEESQDSSETPGQTPILGLILLLGLFLIAAISVQHVLTPHELSESGTHTLSVFAAKIAPSPIASLAVLALLTSTAAVLQASILPVVRVAFSMSRDGVLGPTWTKIHPRYGTPWLGTIIVSGATVAITLASVFLKSLNDIVLAGVIAAGVLLSLFYALAGVACTVYYRDRVLRSAREFFVVGVIPIVSSLSLFGLAIYLEQDLWNSPEAFALNGANPKFQAVFPVIVFLAGFAVLAFTHWRRRVRPRAVSTTAPVTESAE